MKTLSSGFNTLLQGQVLTLATCWKVTLLDSTVLGFTDHDVDLVVDTVTYKASTGFTASSVDNSSSFAVDNMEVTGILSSPAITDDDMNSGKWDYAQIEIFLVNWADLSMGVLKLQKGHIGNITTHRNSYQTELRGLSQAYTRVLCELVQSACLADLGDSRCTKDLTDFTASGSVSSVTSTKQFVTNLTSATVRLSPSSTGAPTVNYFNNGKLTWLTGLNTGLESEVKTYSGAGEIILKLPASYAITNGDTFTVYRGCNKVGRLGDCKLVFNNYVNFHGFDDLPGLDQIAKIGGQ